MGKLIIERDACFCACAAIYNILLDNVIIDNVCNGEIREYNIPEGIHTLYLKNGICGFGTKSNVITFCIGDNDTITISCKSGLYNLSGILLKVNAISEGNSDTINNVIVPNYDELYNRYNIIEKLFSLKENDCITEEEFENEKRKILR